MTHTFFAMGTTVTVIIPGLAPAREAGLAGLVGRLFEEQERVFSRFRPGSELSRLNRSVGPTVVSDALCDALSRAARHRAATRGVFDPAVGACLAAAGYDRSFAPGALDREWPAAAPRPPRGWTLDRSARRVEIDPGVELDLGGMVKGLTVDRALDLLPSSAAVDAGGDAALRGDGPEGEGWLVDVEDPRDASRVLVTLRLRGGAIATSASNRRSWRRGTARMHHLINPRTGAPAETDLAQATVLTETAERADVLAKVAFVLGSSDGATFLREVGASGVLVKRDGRVLDVGRLEVCDA